MQGKLFKFFIIIILVILLINIFPSKAFSDWVGDAENFLGAGKKDDDNDKTTVAINQELLNDASSDIYNMLSSIGMIISVIVGIILGIIYMMSSAVDKAKVKESLTPYLVGSFVIFGAFGIWKIVINTLGGL